MIGLGLPVALTIGTAASIEDDTESRAQDIRSIVQRAIFISYRRSDSEGEAGRLSDVLASRFSDQAVFMDVDAIQPGRDFRKAIDESIQACAVLLTVIGPDWLDATNAAGERRLDEPNDFVRLEIAAALRRDIAVIPILVRGARAPQADRLPPDIQDLAYRNSVELTHSRWKSDLQLLIHALEPYMVPAETPAATALPPATRASALPPATLERVTRLLAHYIGPIAEVMVKRSATRHSTLIALSNALAEEIDAPADKREFLAKATTEPTPPRYTF